MAREQMNRPALNLTAEQVRALATIETNVRKIQALAGDPHWHVDRRWHIKYLAGEVEMMLEAFTSIVTSSAGG